ncbi:MAG: amphi-Trp domain-containing protein [Bacillota bacterium]
MTKLKWVKTREELAAFLESVVAQIKEGKLTIDKTTVELPEKAEVEFEAEARKGKKEVELEIKWELDEKTGAPEETGSEIKQNGSEPEESEEEVVHDPALNGLLAL